MAKTEFHLLQIQWTGRKYGKKSEFICFNYKGLAMNMVKTEFFGFSCNGLAMNKAKMEFICFRYNELSIDQVVFAGLELNSKKIKL